MPDNRVQGVPLAEAAEQLGMRAELVRQHIYRNKLHGYKVKGRWYVVLPEYDAKQDTKQDTARHAQDSDGALSALVRSQDHQIAFLQSELTARTEELRRKDIIIADLARRVHALPETVGLSPASQMAVGDERATSANGYQQDGSWWTRVHDLMHRGTA